MAWHCRGTVFLVLIILFSISVVLHGQQAEPMIFTLEEAKSILLANNPLLQAERRDQEVASAHLTDVSKRPDIEVSVSTAGLGSEPQGGSFLNNQEFSATVSYEIETQGKREKRTQLARHEIGLSQSKAEDLVRRLLWELKQRYYRVVLAQREVEFSREIEADFDRLVNLTRIRYQNGEVSGRELRRMEAEQYRFQEDVIGAEVLLENAQGGLLALLGYEDLDRGIQAVDDFASSFNPPALAELKQVALVHRKDLEGQERRIEQAQARVSLEKARSAPNWRLFGGYRREFGHDGASVGVSLPLFRFNKNEGAVASAQLRSEQARLILEDLRIRVFEEIQSALNQLQGKRRRFQALTSIYLEKTQQARDISETAYSLGSIPLLEFLDAERIYREAVRRHNQTLYDLQIGWARLELAVGRDLP